MSEPEHEPYFIEVFDNGCRTCGSDRTWTIFTPDGESVDQSWDNPAEPLFICGLLNDAYERGRMGRNTQQSAPSDGAWKDLALRLAEEAQTCLDNAHWEVNVGSGDMRKTIKTIRLMAEVEAA